MPHGGGVIPLAGLDILGPGSDPVQLREEVTLDDLLHALHVLLFVKDLYKNTGFNLMVFQERTMHSKF